MKIQCIPTGILKVNTYIVPVGDNKVFVVDPAGCELTQDADKVISYLKANNLICVCILLTHCHFDHISGVKALHDAFPDSQIAISTPDAEDLGYGRVNRFCVMHMHITELVETLTACPKATRLLNDGDDFFGWQVIFTPGHTKGSICLYNPETKDLISGDTIFFDGYGRTDLPGGNESELMESIALLRDKIFAPNGVPQKVTLYPGH